MRQGAGDNSGRERRLRVVALTIAAIVPLSMLSPSASAQTEPREVLLGTFGASAQRTPQADSGNTTSSSSTTDAPAMLANALGMLGAGDRVGAGRLFERLVAAHPESREAQHARRYLGEAYRNEAASSRGAFDDRAMEAPVAPAPTAGASDAADAWRASVRTDTALEHRLISEVGDRVFFSAGSADLGSRARSVLEAQANWLKRQPRINATIEGHADEPGSAAENRALSEARAEAVRKRLIEEGVAAERLFAVGRARDERVAECPEPECAAQNRRTVTVPYMRDRDPAPVSGITGRETGSVARVGASVGPAISAIETERRPPR